MNPAERLVAELVLKGLLAKIGGWRGAEEVLRSVGASADASSESKLLSELRDEDMETPVFIVPRVVPAGRAVLLVAPDKAGKSTFLAHAVAALSNGDAFLGEFSPLEAGHVLVVAPDEALGDTAGRLRSLGADPEKVRVLTRAGSDLLGHIRETASSDPKPLLIVVDSLIEYARRLGGPVPESGSASQWAAVVRPLVEVAHDSNVAMIILHHARKSDGESRDSSEIAAAVDGTVTMYLPGAKESDQTLRRFRIRARWPATDFAVKLGEGGYELTRWSGSSEQLPLRARILDFLEDNPGATKGQLRKGVKAQRTKVYEELDRLIESGEVANDGTQSRASLRLTAPEPTMDASGVDLSDLDNDDDARKGEDLDREATDAAD